MPISHSDKGSHYRILDAYAAVLAKRYRRRILAEGLRSFALVQERSVVMGLRRVAVGAALPQFNV